MASTLNQNSTNVRNTIAIIGLAWTRIGLAVTAALAPEKAVDAAVHLFSTPLRFAHTGPELALLATGTRYNVHSRHGELAAWRFGSVAQPAIVLVHGWGGRGAQLRAFVPALLEAGYQVVLFDNVGHGFSDKAPSSLVHLWGGLDAVVSDLEANGARVKALIGHSLGAAAIGAWLNQTRRDLPAVLIAPPISVERYSNLFARRLGIAEPVRRKMQEQLERSLGRRWSDFELPHAVAQVRGRALVIHDAHDRDVPQSAGLALARAWAGARFVGTEGLGHRAILRDPTVVRDAVDFVSGRVVFAPPPARGAATYGAPAPIL